MTSLDKIAEQSDSLIALLAAQCSDLERLLALARAETVAAEENNFETVLEIVSERARLGLRLETFQNRISELRQCLGGHAERILTSPVAVQVAELAAQTLLQDKQTHRLLAQSRDEAAEKLSGLDKSKVRINVYSREQTKGLAYSREF